MNDDVDILPKSMLWLWRIMGIPKRLKQSRIIRHIAKNLPEGSWLLTGSWAVEAITEVFFPHSDIDCVIITEEGISLKTIKSLKEISCLDIFFATKKDGVITIKDLSFPEDKIRQGFLCRTKVYTVPPEVLWFISNRIIEKGKRYEYFLTKERFICELLKKFIDSEKIKMMKEKMWVN